MMNHARRCLGFGLVSIGFVLGCSKKEAAVELAPASSAALEAPKAPTPGATMLVVEAPTSSVKFLMDSPLEKIDGDAPGAASGELSVVLDDLSKSSGLVRVDLDKLTLFQQKRADESGEYAARTKSEKQNEHARDWLQIVAREGEVTPEQAAANRLAELRIEKVEPSEKNVSGMTGPERKVTAAVSGTLRLHGRQAPASTKVELTFRFAGDKLESLGVKSLEPLTVNLEKFEVHPRDSAGKLVRSITEAISNQLKGKIRNEAPVMFELSAKPK